MKLITVRYDCPLCGEEAQGAVSEEENNRWVFVLCPVCFRVLRAHTPAIMRLLTPEDNKLHTVEPYTLKPSHERYDDEI